MKASEIKVGGFYEAKVSEKIVVVRVDKITRVEATSYSKAFTRYTVTNLATNRVLSFDSAMRFRRERKDPRVLKPNPPPAPVTAPPKPEQPRGGQHGGPSAPNPAGEAEALAVLQAMEEATPPLSTDQRNAAEVKRSGLMAALAAPPVGEQDTSPHLIVEARAGTGKTTTLLHGIKRMLGLASELVPSPQQAAVWESMELSKGKAKSVCFVAFNKSIADELKAKVPAGCQAMTMHGLGFRAVNNSFGRGLKVDEYRVPNIISRLLGRDWRDLQREKPVVCRATDKLVGLCKMNLVMDTHPTSGVADNNPDKVTGWWWAERLSELASYYEIDLADDNGRDYSQEVFELVPRVLEECKNVRKDMSINFDDQIWLPVALDLPVQKFDVLLVDEAQDLNRCQQALAKKAGRRLILCGDPKQAIYGFAGADAESMPRMARELGAQVKTEPEDRKIGPGLTLAAGSTTTWQSEQIGAVLGQGHGWQGRGCVVLPLTVTRRCGKAIVKEAKKIVPDFEAFETNPEGVVRRTSLNPKSPDHYAKVAADGDMVLCRVNAPLVSECFRFLKAGRKANIQGRDVGQGLISTVKKSKATTVVAFIEWLEDWLAKERAKENAKKFPSEAKLIALEDRHDCLACFCDGCETTDEVVRKIETVFTNDRNAPGIKLSSIHKAKGLEANCVYLLEPEGATVPHPMAKTDWQKEQEWNLRYVAITRAIEELVYVS